MDYILVILSSYHVQFGGCSLFVELGGKHFADFRRASGGSSLARANTIDPNPARALNFLESSIPTNRHDGSALCQVERQANTSAGPVQTPSTSYVRMLVFDTWRGRTRRTQRSTLADKLDRSLDPDTGDEKGRAYGIANDWVWDSRKGRPCGGYCRFRHHRSNRRESGRGGIETG